MIFPCLLLFALHVLLTAGETGCPEAEDIAPCTCTGRPTVILSCSELESEDDLLEVFANSERYTFHQVHVSNSVLMYIPSQIFQKVAVKELYLRNLTLQALFTNLVEENYDIIKLKIESTNVWRTITAENFTRFVNLKEINVLNSYLKTFSKRFGEMLPKSIKKIILSNTGTKSISNGALNQVPNLDKFEVESGNLKKLSRDVFPRPFYGRIIKFDGNKISTIPEDLFTDMPNLQFFSMMDNAISVIPETAFAGRTVNIPYFRLEGNPVQCDCRLLWLIQDKPEVLGGTCSGPEKLIGRNLKDLLPAEISCV